MTNYERITATPEALGAFLETLPIASGPWDVEFHRTFCKDCTAANCDGGNCPNNAQRNNPLWWLMQDGGRELPQGGPADGRTNAADNLAFLRDFLEGKTRWTFPEGTTFNVTVDVNGTSGMETTQKGAEKEPPAVPEPVTLGPGTSFRLENTNVSKPCVAVDGVNVDVLPVLNNLCGFCRAAAKHGGVTPEREWAVDAAALEFAISVLSELREIKEVRIPAQTDTPGAWELMRDILAGKRPAPEGTVFDVVIDMTGNPQAIRRRKELGYTARSLTLTMPGGDTVKLNSAAEAYGLAACIENMAARVWPDSKPGK